MVTTLDHAVRPPIERTVNAEACRIRGDRSYLGDPTRPDTWASASAFASTRLCKGTEVSAGGGTPLLPTYVRRRWLCHLVLLVLSPDMLEEI